jgi:ribosomal protein S18 acetylase RimI-like enzyme
MKKTTKIILKTATKVAVKSAKKAAVKYAENAALEAAGIRKDRQPRQVSDTVIMRNMRRGDRDEVLEMMRTFYASEAVFTNGSDEIFRRDISECISESPYAEGFVFAELTGGETEAAGDQGEKQSPKEGRLLGYAMIAHSFSTEFGRRCIWIEDIYLKEEARGLGLASQFLDYLASEYPDALHRLEAEHENGHAMEIYKRKGFGELPYVEMVRNTEGKK